MLDPTIYKDWQIAEEAEKTLPSVDYFREKLGLLPEEILSLIHIFRNRSGAKLLAIACVMYPR